jgi:hypothetical protein
LNHPDDCGRGIDHRLPARRDQLVGLRNKRTSEAFEHLAPSGEA